MRGWLELAVPEYGRLRRYRPARKLGPVTVHWNPDYLPWPQVSVYQGGTYVALGVQIGPLGPDPVLLSFDVTIRRPGVSS